MTLQELERLANERARRVGELEDALERARAEYLEAHRLVLSTSEAKARGDRLTDELDASRLIRTP